MVLGVVWLALLGSAGPAFADQASTALPTTVIAHAPASGTSVAQTTTDNAGTTTDRAEAITRGGEASAAMPASDAARTTLEAMLRATFAASAFSAIGVLFFVLTVSDGSRPEFDLLCRVAQGAALVAAVVAIVQIGVRGLLMAGGVDGVFQVLPSVLASGFGSGMALRAVGAALLSVGASTLRRTALARVAIVGASLVISSFALAGYAADAQPRAVSILALVAHVAAAAAWGGGLLALAITLAHRHRAGRPLRAGYVAARFSVLATLALALASAAGVALAWVRLGSVAELWTTTYGLLLVAKISAVGVITALGAHNHFVVVPILKMTPDHQLGRRLRWLGSLEVALFALVVGINSTLVGIGG